jgi:hypothetical protein
LANTDVSVAILGFSRLSQVEENLKALELYAKWDRTIEKRVREITNNDVEPEINFNTWTPSKLRRDQSLNCPGQL